MPDPQTHAPHSPPVRPTHSPPCPCPTPTPTPSSQPPRRPTLPQTLLLPARLRTFTWPPSHPPPHILPPRPPLAPCPRAYADSKTLTEAQREGLFSQVVADEALAYRHDVLGAGVISAQMLGRCAGGCRGQAGGAPLWGSLLMDPGLQSKFFFKLLTFMRT
jgi:hypothetical protein